MSDTETKPNGYRHDIIAMLPECPAGNAPAEYELRHCIEGIKTLIEIEHKIESCWNCSRVEWGFRLYTMRAQSFDRARPNILDPRIIAWMKDDIIPRCSRQYSKILMLEDRGELPVKKRVRKQKPKQRGKRVASIDKRASLSQAQRKRWADPEQRQKQSQKMREVLADPTQRQKRSQQQRKRWADPEQRQKQSQKMREVLANPSQRQKQSQRMRERYADPSQRQKQSQKLREAYARRRKAKEQASTNLCQ